MNSAQLKKIGLLAFVISAIGFAVFIVFNDRGITKYLSVKSEVDSLQQKVMELNKEKSSLKAGIDSLEKSVPRKIERVARERYSMKRENEKVYKVIIE
mgnify:CR=1 FL=1